MHIFSLCIIDVLGQLPANLGARPSSHAYFIINDCMLYLFTVYWYTGLTFCDFFVCFFRCNKSGRKWILLAEVFKVICQYNYVYFRNISSVATTKSWFSLHASALCKVLKTSRVTTLFSSSPLFTILHYTEIRVTVDMVCDLLKVTSQL